MKKYYCRLLTMLLAAAMLFTMGGFSCAYATDDTPDAPEQTAVFDAEVVSAEWVSDKVAEITFSKPVLLGEDIKSKVQYQGTSFMEKYLGSNDSISANGNKVTVSVPDRVGDMLFFHPGALVTEEGAENTDLIKIEVKLDKRITKAVYSPSSLGPDGGSVNVRLEGKNLYTTNEWLTIKIYCGEELIRTITPEEGAMSFRFALPANTGAEDVVYRLDYVSSKFDYNAKPVALDEGVANTITVEGSGVAQDPAVDEISYSSTQLRPAGGKVTVSLNGTALTQLKAEDFSITSGGEAVDLESLGFSYTGSDTEAEAVFTLPANTSEDTDAVYVINILRGADGVAGNGQEITVNANTGEPFIDSINYDKNSSDLHGGSTLYYVGGPLHAALTGENLEKLSASDFAITIDGEDTETVGFKVDSCDETSAAVTFTFPENDLEQTREYTITALKAGENVSDRVLAIEMDARPQDKTDKFLIETNMWDAAEIGDGVVRVAIDASVGAKLRVSPDDYKHYEDFFEQIKDYIYFSDLDSGSRTRELTPDDMVFEDGNDIIIALGDTEADMPHYVVFKTGALKNNEGLILGNDEYNRDHNRYIKKGAHIESISYNKITFDSNGGEVVADVRGTMLNESADILAAKIFVDSDKEASSGITPDVSVAADGKSASFRFTVPANTTDRTVTYKLTPVVNGTNAVPQYIKGYDVIAVLPKGAKTGDTTLSSVEIQGAYDMDDRLDVFKTSTSAEQFTTKIDAVIRGTNLSSKKTSVRAVDENGVVWPMLPVFECGATIRWQNSSSYLPEKASKNEQHIELLIPRRLGVTRDFRLEFAIDGENFLKDPTAEVIVENDGLYDEDAIGSGLFRRSDFTELQDIEVLYQDEQGNALAEPDHFKGYGITELYHQGIAPKKIDGYEVKETDPVNLRQMLTPPEKHPSGEYIFTEGQWFVKHLEGNPIVYTYAKAARPAKVTSPATKITKRIKGKKSFTVKWQKKSGVNGYQIQYSLKKNFSKSKTVTVKKAKITKKTIKKL